MYSKINLQKTTYTKFDKDWVIFKYPPVSQLQEIYRRYCAYKKFKSVMPIFDSEFEDTANDVFGYYENNTLVAFSLIHRYDNKNVESFQFAWTYSNPKLRLGIKTLKHECAYYRDLGFENLYLGGNESYKSKFQGFQVLGTLDE